MISKPKIMNIENRLNFGLLLFAIFTVLFTLNGFSTENCLAAEKTDPLVLAQKEHLAGTNGREFWHGGDSAV